MDELGIYNRALNEIGVRSNLSSITEKDRGAEVCRLWYPIVRDQVQAGAPWPSCKKSSRLALLSQADPTIIWDETQPDVGYQFAYAHPSDMLTPRYMSDYSQFVLSTFGASGVRALMTNTPQAILIYTRRNTDIDSWEVQLQMATIFALAANISGPLTGKSARGQNLLQQANSMLLSAQVTAANSDQSLQDTIPDWIRARGYADGGSLRYFQPYMPLSIGTAVNVR